MAQPIVTCPSCRKKYRIAEGSKAGQFQCTNCNTTISYGTAGPASYGTAGPAAGPGRPAGRPAGRAAGKPGRATAARGPARGAAGRRGPVSAGTAPAGRAPRGRRQRGDDDGPPPKSNAALYTILGIGAVAVLALVLVLVLSGGDDNGSTGPGTTIAGGNGNGSSTPAGNGLGSSGITPANGGGITDLTPAGSGTDSTQGTTTADPGTPGGGVEATPRDPTRVPTPAAGGENGSPGIEGSLYGRSKRDLLGVPDERLMADLAHLESTPREEREKIDRWVEILIDLDKTSEVRQAQRLLIQSEKAAFPRVLSAFKKIKPALDTEDGLILAALVDDTLRSIAGDERNVAGKIHPMAADKPSLTELEQKIRYWYLFWYEQGYKLEKLMEEDSLDDE